MIRYITLLLFTTGVLSQTPMDGVYLSSLNANGLQMNVCPDGSFKIIDKYDTIFFTSPSYNQVLFEGILVNTSPKLGRKEDPFAFRKKTMRMTDTVSEKDYNLDYYELKDYVMIENPGLEGEGKFLLFYLRSTSDTICL